MQVYIGIDWSQNKHDAVFMNQAGAAIARLTLPHSPEGFTRLDTTREQMGISAAQCLVGIETSHNTIVDFLWARGYSQVYVIPPSVVKSNRHRYRQSGARSDQSDAFLVADILRTDRTRLQPWFPDSHLTRSIIRLSNRLRAVLFRYYPAALMVFSELAIPITLSFIQAYPTPESVEKLSFDEFRAFARKHRHPNPNALHHRFTRLQAPQPKASQETVLVYQGEVPITADLLLNMVQAKKKVLRELKALFKKHPDHAVFASLPGVGDYLAPALLAKFGDDRHRFPTPSSVQSLAGTCPVTSASGKRKVIRFRYSCDREFRHIAIQWARCSLKVSVWANAYWERSRPHCHSESHAYRCLANRWLAIAWKLWQTGKPYDEAYHLRQRTARSRPRN